MKRVMCVVLLILLPLVGILAVQEQQIIPLGSPVYADMDDLYLVLGIGTPSDSRPWSMNEARAILSIASRQPLSGVTKQLYDQIASNLEAPVRWSFGDGFSGGVYLDLAGEFYAHSNTDVSDGFTSYEDWGYGFVDRKPLAKLRLDMAVSDFFYTYCDLQYGYGIARYDDELSTLGESGHSLVGALTEDTSLTIVDGDSILSQYTKAFSNNLIGPSRDFDFQWPKRAIISVGGSQWNFTMGRDKLEWGNSHIGNFVYDNHVDFQEYARFTVVSEYFKYEAVDMFFDTSYSDDEFFRMMMSHRLEFRPLHKITIAVSENVMYKDTVLDFRFLNPAFIYHNLNERSKFNALAHLEVSYTAMPGLNVYGQFCLDQAVAPNENDSESTAWGALAGIEYATTIGKGIYSTYLEGVMTLPCLYRRDGIDFVMSRRYAGLEASGNSHWYTQKFDYIGFPYGGDTLVFEWGNSYRVPSLGKIGFSLSALLHGEVDMYTVVCTTGGYANYGSTLFLGDVIYHTYTATLTGERELKDLVSWLSGKVYAQIDWIVRSDYTKATKTFDNFRQDLQCSMGVTVSL
ncbi:hypothetical protein [uncultured Sphaerochaeta sp.]|uniref:hypothetical protein n=1 Tax=uncultured Sphaerochaeta sp. TaxID=886478 RepID=UPI002A0A2A41|nr:hypothetical protein [uncultured Sphaerochaeta sp.]